MAAARTRPVGQTTGTAQREAHRVIAPVLRFDIDAELASLRAEPSYQRGDRNARTLVDEPGFGMVLTALKDGTTLRAHRTDGWVQIRPLVGHLRLHVADETVDLPTGHIMVLEPRVSHDVQAVGESAFLLTIGRGGPQPSEGGSR